MCSQRRKRKSGHVVVFSTTDDERVALFRGVLQRPLDCRLLSRHAFAPNPRQQIQIFPLTLFVLLPLLLTLTFSLLLASPSAISHQHKHWTVDCSRV
jgi:hypothetical protein